MTDPNHPASPAKFDAYARSYQELHRRNITASGEQPEYFAEYKVACLRRLVGASYGAPVLDYGCGTGALTEKLAGEFEDVSGYDPSGACLDEARKRAPAATFYAEPGAIPRGRFGLVVLANVLHHVPPPGRRGLVSLLAALLEPGAGRLVAFEHNPYNPLTRRAVATCEFDDDAILLGPIELTRLLSSAGLIQVRRRFIVFFPRALAALRGLEPHLGWLPAGAQVMAVGRAR